MSGVQEKCMYYLPMAVITNPEWLMDMELEAVDLKITVMKNGVQHTHTDSPFQSPKHSPSDISGYLKNICSTSGI